MNTPVPHPSYQAALPPGAASAYSAHPAAAVTVDPRQEAMDDIRQQQMQVRGQLLVKQAHLDKGRWHNQAADLGANLGPLALSFSRKAGPLANAATLGATAYSSNKETKTRKQELTSLYFGEIVDQLQVPPESVGSKHLEILARQPRMGKLAQELNALEQQSTRDVTKSGIGFGVGLLATAAVGLLGLLTGGLGWLLFTVLSLGASIVFQSFSDKAVDSFSDRHIIDSQDMISGRIEALMEKQGQGQTIQASDVFSVLKAGDAQLRDAIHSHTDGTPFDELPPASQELLMRQEFAPLYKASQTLATLIKDGAMQPTGLVTIDPNMLYQDPDLAHKLATQTSGYRPYRDRYTQQAPAPAMAPASPDERGWTHYVGGASRQGLPEQQVAARAGANPGGSWTQEMQARKAQAAVLPQSGLGTVN